jgi:hypothetical protein
MIGASIRLDRKKPFPFRERISVSGAIFRKKQGSPQSAEKVQRKLGFCVVPMRYNRSGR